MNFLSKKSQKSDLIAFSFVHPTQHGAPEAMAKKKRANMPVPTRVTHRLCGKMPGPEGPLLHWKTLGSHGFGAVVTGLKPKECTTAGSLVILCAVFLTCVLSEDLQSSRLRRGLVDLWRARKGLLVLKDLPGLSREELLEFTSSFGSVEEALAASRSRAQVPSAADGKAVPGVVMRLGNSRDPETGELNASYAVQVPPVGGDTCFADASKAFTTLPQDTQRRLEGLEALCSQAHHDALHNVKKPGTYVLMSPEQRAKMPLMLGEFQIAEVLSIEFTGLEMAVPLVLTHPETKRKSLYGANSSVFRIQPMNSPCPSPELLNRAEGAEAFEDPSVDRELRSLLPHATGVMMGFDFGEKLDGS
eukprot:s1754_g3.t1